MQNYQPVAYPDYHEDDPSTPAYDPVVQYFQKLQEVSMYGGQRVYRRRKTNLGEQKKRQEEILLKRYLKANHLKLKEERGDFRKIYQFNFSWNYNKFLSGGGRNAKEYFYANAR